MKTVLLNTLAILVGLIFGAVVNMSLISLGGQLIPPPDGADVSTMEALAANIHLFAPIHFLSPFLAHALGTLAGALLASKIAASRQLIIAMVIGLAFFVGGSMMVINVPSPLWFNLVDLVFAYFPMAFLGYKLACGKKAED